MRISDWSSDVCSSDLLTGLAQKYFGGDPLVAGEPPVEWGIALDVEEPQSVGADRALNVIAAHAHHPGDLIIIDFGTATTFELGRASCRERVCKYVSLLVVAVSLQTKKQQQ